jgi:hypothetical protein
MIRPIIRFNSLHIEDVHPRVSIWDVNADKLKSIRVADDGGFKSHASLAASIRLFMIRGPSISLNILP